MQIRHAVWLLTLGLIAAMFCALAPRAAWHQTLVERYRPLLEANTLIENHYVNTVEPQQLTDGALRGLMDALDPYSAYLTVEQMRTYEDQLAGNLVGIGVEIAFTSDNQTVLTPLPGSPAEQSGLLPGDMLVSIDETPTRDLSIFAINNRLVGAPGSHVTLVIERSSEIENRQFDVERVRFESDSVRGHVRGDDGWHWLVAEDSPIAHIRIAAFGESMLDQFNKALEQCERDGAKALVLDLRNNPGGLVTQAIQLVDRFVGKSDLPILTIQAQQGALTRYTATDDETDSNIPLVVLVNHYSASAAEIVAGSLQDLGRATVVGEQSFGKGSVQYVRKLQDGGAVRLTSAYYQLPKGRVVHRALHEKDNTQWGIIPDVVISNHAPLENDEQLAKAIELLQKSL
ncbi:MAG TPA: S41 family peptidase [Phycisphaerae bacterium]|nr:S41 family peptidase [Phycisphaerae bacterium]